MTYIKRKYLETESNYYQIKILEYNKRHHIKHIVISIISGSFLSFILIYVLIMGAGLYGLIFVILIITDIIIIIIRFKKVKKIDANLNYLNESLQKDDRLIYKKKVDNK